MKFLLAGSIVVLSKTSSSRNQEHVFFSAVEKEKNFLFPKQSFLARIVAFSNEKQTFFNGSDCPLAFL